MVDLSQQERIRKLVTIQLACDFPTIGALVDHYLENTACPAICLTCDYIKDLEPDQDAGWCSVCRTSTMVSALVLAEVL